MPRASRTPRARLPARDSRARLLAAAVTEFAAGGFGSAKVDRIARRARLNKAMIYYHFGSKVGLYREVIRHEIRGFLAALARAGVRDVEPEEGLGRFVGAFIEQAASRPDFPPLMMRELADRGRHLDTATLALIVKVPETFGEILAAGVEAGRFRRINPFLGYYSVVGPILFHFASSPVRARLESPALERPDRLSTDDLRLHVHASLLARLTVESTEDRRAVHGRPQ